MAKYKFIKNFTARVTVGGVVGVTDKSFFVGDVYEGEPKGDFVKIRIAPHTLWNEGAPSNMSYQEMLDIPKEYLREAADSNIFSKQEVEIKSAKLQIEIAKLPNGAERDKLIAQQNALQAELNRASEKNLKLYIGLGIVAVLAVGYFAYKKLKK